ncbi:helix-turn-helix domain-containing protein [Subtercola lobariae]|uniref:RNA polymerase subunit sigma-70 n=1 Tax=Subtercola lobariae TaxID=1588641 RepID=A0A917BGE8_9MICO|nr:helix-turn-helix domain-containing protein [Subtercola lobariae]GGF39770.1 hypothetical protein GCM10011399_35840 [Subtercola lobariae]
MAAAVLSVWVDKAMASVQTDGMEMWNPEHLSTADPATGLRAVGALHRLAEQIEALYVDEARRAGWSWEQIGDALGVRRQSVHAKHGKRESDV